MPEGSGIGAPVRRKEDQRFITGTGRYTDDFNRHGQAYAYFLRSPHAHAKINAIKTDAAKKAPGVVAVFTGADLEAAKVGGLICGWRVTQINGEGHVNPKHPVIAVGKVRHVGEMVAMVIADRYEQAKDAAELIEVDYEELTPSVDLVKTFAKSAPLIHDDAPGNLCYEWEVGDKAATEAAFKNAAHVTKLDLIQNRLIPNAMEPRAALGEYNPANGEFTLTTTSQNPHVARLIYAAFIGIAPEHKIRVIAPDVGGGFGSKIYVYGEDTAVLWAAGQVGRPVKWTGDRSEAFLSDAHGRDHVTHAELALDKDNKFIGLRVDTTANMGAYLQVFSTCVPTYLYACLLAGQYKTPAIYCFVKAGFTNTGPVDAYRGAGRPEATYVVERLVEKAARELSVDSTELRRKNFIAPEEFPYQTPVLMTYDSGNFNLLLDRGLEMIKYKDFPARKAESEKRGKLRGIGFSCFIESCGLAPSRVIGALGGGVGQWESANIKFNPTGSVLLYTGSHSHGQGHETVFAQIVSDALGVPIEQVEVIHGDTGIVPFGMGTYGSRSGPVGGGAVKKAADKIVEKGKKIAAHLLEASVNDIEYSSGVFKVAGTDRQKSMGEIAFAAYVPHNYPLEELEPGLDETAFFDPVNFTFPSGTYIAEVEVDPQTGVVELQDWVAVDDFGTILNPLIVDGQVHGGIAQGVGQALYENCVYDNESGQLLTGSYMDYCMPRADTLPPIRLQTTNIPCPHNPIGAKGCGEAGAIASPAAVINAVVNAIGVDIDMPATPEKVWRALQSQKQAAE
ncbi:MAG: xanthine dehydrogenase family protein molybdopterin-binding subunit [Kiloniellales bacterium]